MLRVNLISFPGLGIPAFKINSVAFTLFGREIAWYGIIITLGMILACLYVAYRAKEKGIVLDEILNLAIFVIVFGVLGARLYYVLTSLDSYDSFIEVFQIWNGGLGIYGGIIAGAITLLVYCKVRKFSFLMFADMVCPAVMIGQILGRYGNFMNAEAYGSETALPWRMGIQKVYNGIPYGETIYVHPTFFYESMWNLIGFLLINSFYKNKKYDGQVFYMCFAWYGFGRMFIELLRSDSLYLGSNHVWYLKISFLVGLIFFIVFASLLIYNYAKNKNINTNKEN